MLANIRSDIHRYSNALGPRARNRLLRLFVSNFGLHATLVYRFGRWLYEGRRRPLLWIRLVLFPLYWPLIAYVRLAYNIHLDLSADIGPGLLVWHFGGIRLSNCRLGRLCTIHQQVRIGPARSLPGPWLGDEVWIGPHAQVVGPYRVGSGATIAAGAVVARDLPARTLSMGSPARVILANFDNKQSLKLALPAMTQATAAQHKGQPGIT